MSDPKITVRMEGLDKMHEVFAQMGSRLRGSIMDKVLESVAWLILSFAQNNARIKLNKHPTGNLINNMRIQKEGKLWVVGVFGTVYAKIHEFGGIIVPRKARRLSFQIDGKWLHTNRSVIPARPYLRPAVDDHLSEIRDMAADVVRKEFGPWAI